MVFLLEKYYVCRTVSWIIFSKNTIKEKLAQKDSCLQPIVLWKVYPIFAVEW